MDEGEIHEGDKAEKKSEIKTAFYKELLYIFLGTLLFFILINQKGSLRLVSGAGFLFALYHLILIIRASPEIIDKFFPSKYTSEKVTKSYDRFMYYASPTFFFLSLIFLVTEMRGIDNTLSGINLFWKAGSVGLLMAIILTGIIKKSRPSVYFQSKRRFAVNFGLFIGFFLFGAASANFINHTFYGKIETCSDYRVIRKSINVRTKSHYL